MQAPLVVGFFSLGKASPQGRRSNQNNCKVCSKICEKEVVLVAKNDNLRKHQRKKTTKRLGHWVPI